MDFRKSVEELTGHDEPRQHWQQEFQTYLSDSGSIELCLEFLKYNAKIFLRKNPCMKKRVLKDCKIAFEQVIGYDLQAFIDLFKRSPTPTMVSDAMRILETMLELQLTYQVKYECAQKYAKLIFQLLEFLFSTKNPVVSEALTIIESHSWVHSLVWYARKFDKEREVIDDITKIEETFEKSRCKRPLHYANLSSCKGKLYELLGRHSQAKSEYKKSGRITKKALLESLNNFHDTGDLRKNVYPLCVSYSEINVAMFNMYSMLKEYNLAIETYEKYIEVMVCTDLAIIRETESFRDNAVMSLIKLMLQNHRYEEAEKLLDYVVLLNCKVIAGGIKYYGKLKEKYLFGQVQDSYKLYELYQKCQCDERYRNGYRKEIEYFEKLCFSDSTDPDEKLKEQRYNLDALLNFYLFVYGSRIPENQLMELFYAYLLCQDNAEFDVIMEIARMVFNLLHKSLFEKRCIMRGFKTGAKYLKEHNYWNEDPSVSQVFEDMTQAISKTTEMLCKACAKMYEFYFYHGYYDEAMDILMEELDYHTGDDIYSLFQWNLRMLKCYLCKNIFDENVASYNKTICEIMNDHEKWHEIIEKQNGREIREAINDYFFYYPRFVSMFCIFEMANDLSEHSHTITDLFAVNEWYSGSLTPDRFDGSMTPLNIFAILSTDAFRASHHEDLYSFIQSFSTHKLHLFISNVSKDVFRHEFCLAMSFRKLQKATMKILLKIAQSREKKEKNGLVLFANSCGITRHFRIRSCTFSMEIQSDPDF